MRATVNTEPHKGFVRTPLTATNEHPTAGVRNQKMAAAGLGRRAFHLPLPFPPHSHGVAVASRRLIESLDALALPGWVVAMVVLPAAAPLVALPSSIW